MELLQHAPGHLRRAFEAIAEECWEEYEEHIFDEEMAPPPADTLWRMSTCSDYMPRHICEMLGVPPGSNYAMGVGAYFAEHGVPEQ